MSTIGGQKREKVDFQESSVKKVGLFEASVVCINPDAEEYKELLGIELKEDSKATEYLGTSQDGNTYLRVDVWLQDVKDVSEENKRQGKYKVTFFLENKERENKDMTKKQYINAVGSCAWADDENNLQDWFKARDYRVAKVGEEELYGFLRTWLGELDYRNAETTLEIDWKKLMKGNVKDLREQIDGEWCTNVIAMATISVKEKEGERKEYQGVYNKKFLPQYCMKNFRLINYMDDKILTNLRAKKPKDLKPHERFALDVNGEHGCKDFFILRDIVEYDAETNITATDKVITTDGADY